ncbi:TMEM175 family protein [Halostagnicola sp. A-GB9-2]|uniref:TMEM175 family protein n=1 Tax=Halostagnicola sp. A-GB9-2 TaxID=3048066 RepID=UPI0024C001D6|nr:TMEM175 family protein [Halostagnicola sp. A-GB9-2]MDJ1432589.1 TMEM175 family protein [Halostagnicola sp. A-GB9-2]
MVRVHMLEGETTDRMEALSDGVFAIVLTLLVLQFEVPDVPADRAAADLPGALADQQALLLSYLLSFFVVGIYWIVHHNLFQQIVRHDRLLLYLNLAFLLVVSFLPFPTELLGVYGTHLTWTLYAINIALVGIILTILWWYADRRAFTSDAIDDRTGFLITLRGLIAPAVFLLSIGVAAVNLSAAFFVPLLIFPLQVLWTKRYQDPELTSETG